MADYADRLWDGRSHQPIAAVKVSPVLSTRVISPNHQRTNYSQRRRSPSHQGRHRRHATHPPVGDICFYHEKFGSTAQKCRAPCSYPSRNGRAAGSYKYLRMSAAYSFSFKTPSADAGKNVTLIREQPEAYFRIDPSTADGPGLVGADGQLIPIRLVPQNSNFLFSSPLFNILY